MQQGPRKVLLDQKLAGWSAAYLAMWKALESFDPKADRWSEPVNFGSRQERIQAAENAIARAGTTGISQNQQQDIEAFRDQLTRLATGSPYGPEQDQFVQHVRQIGSSLADQSVTAASVAEN